MKFMGSAHSPEESFIILRGYPFDGTCSYRPGSRFAPDEIRLHSEGIETYSPRFDKDIEKDMTFYDAENLDLPFGNTDRILKSIENDADSFFKDNKVLIGIGGEHLVSLPLIKACAKKYPDLHVLHFDAHMDLRTDYLGEPYSHATVIRRVLDFLPVDQLFQFGIRSGTKEEFTFSKTHNLLHSNVGQILSMIKKETPLYMTVDMDILDPSIFPGTGTPEPGGWAFNGLVNNFSLLRGYNIVGADVMELAPKLDNTDVSTAVACKLIREMMVVIDG